MIYNVHDGNNHAPVCRSARHVHFISLLFLFNDSHFSRFTHITSLETIQIDAAAKPSK